MRKPRVKKPRVKKPKAKKPRAKKPWSYSTPCVVVGHVRSGSTFLAHCLSAHPEIHCFRSEPLEPGSVWFKKLNAQGPEILDVVLEQWGYKVSACKLTLKHLTPRVRRYLKKKARLKVIQLSRDNVLRTAVSAMIHTRYRRGALVGDYGHSYEKVKPANVMLSPQDLLTQCRRVALLRGRLNQRVKMLRKPVLKLTYTSLVGNDGPGPGTEYLSDQATAAICQFLGLEIQPMKASIQRVNRYPLSQTISNWPAVRVAVEASVYAKYLEGED